MKAHPKLSNTRDLHADLTLIAGKCRRNRIVTARSHSTDAFSVSDNSMRPGQALTFSVAGCGQRGVGMPAFEWWYGKQHGTVHK